MIHYHGLPITPAAACAEVISGGHAFVSFAHPDQLPIALDCAQSFALDNGAFSFWKGGKTPEWDRYTEWVAYCARLPSFDFAVIPDVIDGDEAENDALVGAWPWWWPKHRHYGAPVWHLHESIARLENLAGNWPRICIGSSGAFAQIGTPAWWNRMAEAFNAICDKDGRPVCKVHGLRMLDPEVFTRFPFASCDSTNVGQNIGIDSAWRGTYQPPDKAWRAKVLRARIESQQGPQIWDHRQIQQRLDLSTPSNSHADADSMQLPLVG